MAGADVHQRAQITADHNFEQADDQYELDENGEKFVHKRQIVWRNVIGLTVLHVVAIYSYCTLVFDKNKPWWAGFVVDAIARSAAIGVTAGSHRLWSHRSYKARLPLRVVLMLLHTMALQDDIYQWCRDHRLHHKHSDTVADPYNSKRGFFFSHVGWLLVRKHPAVREKGRQIDLSDLWDDPVVRFQRRFYVPLVLIFWGLVPTYLFYKIVGCSFVEAFLGACIFRYMVSLHHTWLVNSAAHLYGYQSYDKIGRDSNWVNFLTMGESMHNFHHAFPQSYLASEMSWDKTFNITAMFIDAMAWIGQAYDLRKPSQQVIDARVNRMGNNETRKRFLDVNIVLNYILGFAVFWWLMFVTWGIRYYLNGHI